jgi:integrase/recombinase XerD
LGCGGRDEEVQFAFYADISFTKGEFSVKENQITKPGFTIKGKQEREIPLPELLVKLLWERRKRYPDSRYIFPAPHGGRNVHFLRLLKKQALKNGFNCGACAAKNGESCVDHPVCQQWILHRFRKTFATMHYRSKVVTMKTLQKWLGHENLETTELYLADEMNDDPGIRAAVNNTFAFAHDVVPPSLYL